MIHGLRDKGLQGIVQSQPNKCKCDYLCLVNLKKREYNSRNIRILEFYEVLYGERRKI